MKAPSGKRYPLSLRTTKQLRDRLLAAAEASGRSLAQEIEFRLERYQDHYEIEQKLEATKGQILGTIMVWMKGGIFRQPTELPTLQQQKKARAK